MTYEQHAQTWTIVSEVILCCFCYCPPFVCSSVPVDFVSSSFSPCASSMPVFRLLFHGGTRKRMKISFNSDASWRGPRIVSEAGLPNLPNTKVILALSYCLSKTVYHICWNVRHRTLPPTTSRNTDCAWWC